MSTYDEAVSHVLNGGTAWESESWDTDSLLYLNRGKLWSHCGASGTDQKFTPDKEDIDSSGWELLDKMANKYGAKKTVIDGITFASNAEARRYMFLRRLCDGHTITDLRMQVKFELAPEVVIQGRKRPPIRYIADFVYIMDGKKVVEDVKGMLTPVYRIKRHLMATVHGIHILETK